MKYLKRTFNLLMAVVIVFNIAVNDYIVANATGVDVLVPTLSMLDSFLITFGVSLGFGSQLPSKSTTDKIEDFVKAMAEGGTFEVSGYGIVDFSSDASVKDYTQWAEQFYTPSFGLDKISYLNTGTSASKAIKDYIVSFNQVADVDDGAFDRMRQVAQYLINTQVNIGSGNKPEPENEPDFDLKNWWIACGGVLAACFGALGLTDDYKAVDDTAFLDYFLSNDAYFIPNSSLYSRYDFVDDPNYYKYCNHLILGRSLYRHSYGGTHYNVPAEFIISVDIYRQNNNICFVKEDTYRCYSFDKINNRMVRQNFDMVDNCMGTWEEVYHSNNNGLNDAHLNCSFYVPLFNDVDSALNYYLYNDLSGILNIDPDYEPFYETVGAPQSILDMLKAGLVLPSQLPELALGLQSLPSGTPDIIPKTEEIIISIPAPQPDPVPEPVPTPTPTPDPEKPTPEPDLSSKSFIDAILALLGILLMLLKIFLHLLEFIINIFKIPADSGFITGDFKLGFEYIKTVKLSPLNMSIYDFLMGLVHITIFFGVVKLLRQRIEKLQL